MLHRVAMRCHLSRQFSFSNRLVKPRWDSARDRDSRGFIARCRSTGPAAQPVCHRAVVLSSGLELRYRFSEALLGDWRKIDNSIVRKVAGFRIY